MSGDLARGCNNANERRIADGAHRLHSMLGTCSLYLITIPKWKCALAMRAGHARLSCARKIPQYSMYSSMVVMCSHLVRIKVCLRKLRPHASVVTVECLLVFPRNPVWISPFLFIVQCNHVHQPASQIGQIPCLRFKD